MDVPDPVTRPADPTHPVRRHRALDRIVISGSLLVGLVVALVVGTNVLVTRGASDVAYDEVADVPARTVAVVFGAGVVDGKPTPALADRVHAAVELYRHGTVGHLLLTGDHSSVGYDEVGAMREQALAEGVPTSAITRDHAGFSTYDSCIRARDVFGVRDAVLVTQDYHLPRALYTCREAGIDAVGLRVPDWQHHPERLTWGAYPDDLGRQYMAREWLARSKAVVAARITHPDPTFLGPYEGLRET